MCKYLSREKCWQIIFNTCKKSRNFKFQKPIFVHWIFFSLHITVHPQNVRFQNVRFQNVRFQNVWNVRFTKRQVYKTSGLQNVRFTKRQVYKTSGFQNVRSSKRPVAKKHPYIYSVLVTGGNPQVLLQPCLQAKWWLCFILYFRGFFALYHHNK